MPNSIDKKLGPRRPSLSFKRTYTETDLARPKLKKLSIRCRPEPNTNHSELRKAVEDNLYLIETLEAERCQTLALQALLAESSQRDLCKESLHDLLEKVYQHCRTLAQHKPPLPPQHPPLHALQNIQTLKSIQSVQSVHSVHSVHSVQAKALTQSLATQTNNKIFRLCRAYNLQ
jgi:hypothetical protein